MPTRTYLLSFADSEIAAVLDEGDRVRLRFAAASVEPLAPAGTERPAAGAALASGYLSGLELLLWRAADGAAHDTAPLPHDLLGRIAAGQIERTGDAAVQILRRLAVPAVLAGPLMVRLDCANRSSWVMSARQAEFRLGAAACFREALSC